MKNIIKLGLLGACLIAFMPACSDLEPDFGDQIVTEEFFETEDQFISALGAAYTNLYGFMNHQNYFSLQEVSTDAVCIPHRGPDWEDGKQWIRVHKHDFKDNDGVIGSVWNFASGGINTINRLIFTFENSGSDLAAGFVDELRTLRAYYYWILLDVYGNVPITTDFQDTSLPSTSNRADVFKFIEDEINAALPSLSRKNDLSTYGRANYWMAQALLVNLYMNAEVYTGTPRWSDAVTAADEIINSGLFSMEVDYFANFATDNGNSRETIFAIPYDKVNAQGFNLVQMTLHYESQKTFNTVEQPWNGYCAVADFYNSFEEGDSRINGGGSRTYGVMLSGPQFDTDGVRLNDGADTYYETDASGQVVDTDGREVNFNPNLTQIQPQTGRDEGARLSKYEYEIGSTRHMSNDFLIYRYSDILLLKAEAMWRMNSSSPVALDLVNMIRERAGVSTYSSLDADNLLAERGREMCFEAKRRTDLIRFGSWNDGWWEKPANPGEEFKNLMPIPAGQLENNPNLSQNDGY